MGRKTKVNKLTSPEKLQKINKNNMRLKNDFLTYLKSIQRSPGTIAGYSNDLDIIFTYMLDELGNKDFAKLTKRDIIGIQNWFVSNGNSSARIRRLKAAMSSLSNYCENILADDEPEFQNYRSIVRKIENPALQAVRDKTVWEDGELQAILDKLVEAEQFDKACYLALAMYSGRRKAELCRFKVSDFDDDKLVCDGALYKSAPIKTKGRGGGKMINCYTLAKKFKPYFDLWMEQRNKIGIESVWLFPNRDNLSENIQISTANSWSNTYTRIAGKPAYLHSLRHYFTTTLVRSGIPDSVITQIVGWESADMCKIYTDIDADEQIGMYFKDGDIAPPDKKDFSDI